MDTKLCNVCYRAKPLAEFGRNCKGVLGRLARCKPCDRAVRLRRYRTQPEVRAKAVWAALLQRVGNANGKNPSYANVTVSLTKDQFVAWYVQALPAFFDKYGHTETPSVDRIRGKKGYEFGNIRLIPNAENSRKASNKRNNRAPAGKAWCTHCKKYLPRAEFHTNPSQSHGLSHSCKYHHRLRYASRKNT